MESKKFFPIKVILSDGQVWVEDVYACTKWHAIDILYTKMYKYQDNRKMYKLFRPFKTIA